MFKQSLPYIMLAVVLAMGIYLASIAHEKGVPLTPGAKYYTVKFDNSVTLKTEVAETKEELKTGLMFREKLPKNTGMLFIFGMEFKYTFWMKNTLIPLDIIWINDGIVVQIDANIPIPNAGAPEADIPKYPAKFPVDYVLEVNAGFTQEHGIKVEDNVSLSNI